MKPFTRLTSLVAASVFSFMLSSFTASAGMLRETFRGARAMAMGNAYVGLADDEQAVWYNPAGLGGNRKTEFHYIVSDLSISTDTIGSVSAISKIKNPTGDSLNSLMGQNIYGQEQLSSTLIMPNFGMGLLIDGQVALKEKNRAFPSINLGYQTTSGVQLAYGFSTGGMSRRPTGEWRFGIGAKMLIRRGGYHDIPIVDLVSFDKSVLSKITGNFGTGYGVDLGTQYVRPLNKRLKVSGGVALTDVGGTSFGAGPDPIPQNLSAGGAAEYTLGLSKLICTYDWRHITDATDWRKKSHLGAELALPLLSLYGGVDQTYITYGASFDIWIIKVTGVSYAEENGSFIGQNPERRYTLRLDLKFTL
ncbi:MAG: hypothetical protein H7222_01060 [Methylotenera sp.]|nr:hypothetical protein [Oligoflexia bacterium]